MGLGHQPQRVRGVVVHPFDIEVVIVLVAREVDRALKPGQVHVDLHLREMLRLGLLDAFRRQFHE